MSKVYLYAHGGSGNHGCEAIVRSTISLIKDIGFEKIILISSKPEEDMFYGIDEICEIRKDILPYSKATLNFFKAYMALKIRNDYIPLDKMDYRQALADMKPGDIALSIGGDNYCYANVKKYIMLHSLMKEKGAKTVLWGCSVDPSLVENQEIASDLAKYDLISARETLSYNALKKINNNTILVSDPAFILDSISTQNEYLGNNFIGINISPMVIENEKKSGIVLDNYKRLIEWILKETQYNIMLIPHVIWEGGDDRIPLKSLYDCFKKSKRVVLINDCNCMKLKGIISQCRFFVGARTHATIAAYSSKIPTLVVGYSVKARGIARDLFGQEENYVLSVQQMRNSEELCKAFQWIYVREKEIHEKYEMMTSYKEKTKNAIYNLMSLYEEY